MSGRPSSNDARGSFETQARLVLSIRKIVGPGEREGQKRVYSSDKFYI